jgi:mannosyltransferase
VGRGVDLQTLTADQLKERARPILSRISISRTRQILLGILFAGTTLRLWQLGAKSIWLDEAFSITVSQRSLMDLFRMVVRTDTHPPLYYLLLKFWLLFSQSEAWVRLLSVIFSTLAILLMYLLVTELYQDKRAGLLGAAILAFAPFQIWYAQEARMYAALTFFVLASAYFFFCALQRGGTKYWIGYVIATTLALYIDNGAIWYLVALILFSLVSIRRYWNRAAPWVISNLAIGFLYVFWLPFLYLQARQVTQGFWLPPPSPQTVIGTFLDFQSYNFPIIGLSLLYIAAIFVFAFIVPGKNWRRQLASFWLFLPLGISLLISLRQPIFLSRNLIAASLGFLLLTTDTIWKFQSKKIILAFLVPLLVMNMVSIGRNTWFEEKEDWRDAARVVALSTYKKPGGLVVFVPGFAELPFQYYFKQYGVSVQTQGYPGDEILLHPQPKEVKSIDEMLAGRPYVWLVVRQGDSMDPTWLQIKQWLDTHGFVRYPGFTNENVSVLTYVRWDKAGEGYLPSQEGGKNQVYFPMIANGDKPQVYIVQPGDTILEIALRLKTTVEALATVNHLQNPNKLVPGQELIIP